MPAYIVAIDNGSQSTKVSILDEHGRPHASARVALRPYAHPAPGQVVHPDDDVWDSIAAACRAALERFDGDPDDIVGVGLCTIRFCRAILDERGRLVEPLLSWMDERVAKPHVRVPGERWITTSSGYVTHRLTGRFLDTAANYQGVWPIDALTWRWSADAAAYARTGMPRDELFELVDPGDPLGHVTADAAAATGLPAGLAVYATANDKAVEALGAGLRSESDLVLSLGTYISSMTLGADARATGPFWVNFGSQPAQYLYESDGIRRGMWTVSWFRSLLEGDAGGPDRRPYELEHELNTGAADVPPGAGGLFTILDWLAPGDATYRRGAFVGFDGSQGRYHIYRSILEGIAFTMDDHAGAMMQALDHELERLILTGGGARSDLMAQIVADVFGRPVQRTQVEDSAGMGAAICAAVGSGLHADWSRAIEAMVRYTDPVLPSARGSRAYPRLHAAHTGLRTRMDELSRWLAHAIA